MRVHGISQFKVAKRSGFHPTHVSRWMNGHVKPTLETMVKLDEALMLLIEGR